ncbi:MAG: hypothetical protein ACFWTW_02225 [Lentilactobacillus parabuchneri]|jgi:hypothetical protein
MTVVNGYKQNDNEQKIDILNFFKCQIKLEILAAHQ